LGTPRLGRRLAWRLGWRLGRRLGMARCGWRRDWRGARRRCGQSLGLGQQLYAMERLYLGECLRWARLRLGWGLGLVNHFLRS